MSEPDPNEGVLDYATPPKGGKGMSFRNGQARMISASVLFVGATVLAVSRRNMEIMGIAVGLFALAAFTLEYVRSWRDGDAR